MKDLLKLSVANFFMAEALFWFAVSCGIYNASMPLFIKVGVSLHIIAFTSLITNTVWDGVMSEIRR